MSNHELELEYDNLSSKDKNNLFDLGLMYCTGHEVPRDLIKAHKWFNLAAVNGHEAAREYRAEIAQEMAPEEIVNAQRQARDWMQVN